MMNIYVGNLPYGISDEELEQAFAAHGAVSSAKVITDRDTGRSRGFGFVEMANDSEAKSAIDALNGSQLAGRTVVVRKAEPKPQRRR